MNLKYLEFFSFTELYFLITKFLANGPFKHVGEVSVNSAMQSMPYCGTFFLSGRFFSFEIPDADPGNPRRKGKCRSLIFLESFLCDRCKISGQLPRKKRLHCAPLE